MSNLRFMRLILMYDLDMSSIENVREYNKFRRWLISRGYLMMQYSIYMKILNVPTKKVYEVTAIKQKLPKNGNIRLLTITDKQYYDMQMLRGGKGINESINTEKRRIRIKYDI